MRQFKIFELKDYQKILEFYKTIDQEYYPKLSERSGGLEGHIQNIINRNGNFVLFEVNNNIEGLVGFFPIDKDRRVVQFTLFSFSKQYRNSFLPYRMVKYLIESRNSLGYVNTEKLIARTWYEDSANKLERVGFNKVGVVDGDIIPNRTSYYFEGNLNLIIENVLRK